MNAIYARQASLTLLATDEQAIDRFATHTYIFVVVYSDYATGGRRAVQRASNDPFVCPSIRFRFPTSTAYRTDDEIPGPPDLSGSNDSFAKAEGKTRET